MSKPQGQLSFMPLPVIDFEGKKVKPTKAGFYKCPFKCGPDGFPQPKWKTAAGFKGHMLKCPKRPSALAASAEIQTDEPPKTRSFSDFMDQLEAQE